MKRPLKFRGKRIDRPDTWSYVEPNDDEWRLFWPLVKQSTIGQWTGRYDRIGRAIYEGDMAVVTFPKTCHNGICEIRWSNQDAAWIVWTYEWWDYLMDTQVQVIGTIYDDIELLRAAAQQAQGDTDAQYRQEEQQAREQVL